MGESHLWGSDLAPNHSLQAIYDNAMHGWGYNRHDPENQVRAQSLRLRNLVDEGMAQYTAQLRDVLQRLRRELPEPTRENPFPPKEKLDGIAKVDRFIKSVESLRTVMQTLAVPTSDIVWRKNKEDHVIFLDQLCQLDLALLNIVKDADEDFVERLKTVIAKRNSLLQDYIASK